MKFPNNTHLIGDAVYALHKYSLVPYSVNSHLTQYQKNCNLCHSSIRIIERAFALLKGRWRNLYVLAVLYRFHTLSYISVLHTAIFVCCKR